MTTSEILPRHLKGELATALKHSRVINIVGPRQVGKTTLVRDILASGRFITLDDENILNAIEADPLGQLSSLTTGLVDSPLIIDEAQRSKKLALAIKKIVDEDRRKGQFILTGSSNIFSTLEVADSLAGRMLTLKLWPLTIAEIKSKRWSSILDWATSDIPNLSALPEPERITRADYINLVLRGGYPEVIELPFRQLQSLYRSYIDAIVDRDVADLLRIRKSDALRRLIIQLAVKTATEINISELCEIIGLRRPTIEQYLDVLLRLSVVIKLGAWSSGESRREIKNSKFHFVDSGIAAALRHISSRTLEIDVNPSYFGGLLESFVFSELLRSAAYQESEFRFYHWRDQRGREVDILAEGEDCLVLFEVKASSSITGSDFKHLRWFAVEGPGKKRRTTLIIFYLGTNKLTFGKDSFALPISLLWSNPSYE